LVSKLAYTLSGNLFYSQIDASALGFPGCSQRPAIDAKLKLDYRPTSRDSAQLLFTRT